MPTRLLSLPLPTPHFERSDILISALLHECPYYMNLIPGRDGACRVYSGAVVFPVWRRIYRRIETIL
jgi:hypothetical protein